MTRGRRRTRPDEPERRCVASGETRPAHGLVRFVLDPGGTRAVPDVAGKLPGRGAWLAADRASAARAERRRLFSRAFRRQVEVPEGLADLLERLLAARLVETISLANKAGQAVTGFEKTRARLQSGQAGVMLTARDAAVDGASKLGRIAGRLPRIRLLDSPELGLAFGREFAIHAALDAGGIAERALTEAERLGGFRSPPALDVEGEATGGSAADDDERGVEPGCGSLQGD
ncbi:MAG: RNA-binding protein [Paracoccaceae bacterium]